MVGNGRQAVTAARGSDSEAHELDLVGRVASGDQRAFEELYRCYHPRLWRFLDRVTRRPHLVEEVLNDTLLVVWRKPHTFNGECRLSTWIFAIAFNKAMKALNRRDDPVEANAAEELASEALGPEGLVIQQQSSARLLDALAGLSIEQRAVVELTYFHGYAYREIAEVMSCPVDTVKTRMFHARRKLKVLLGTMHEDSA